MTGPFAGPRRRRFLVVVRAGDTSLHPTWVDVSRPRSFDLVVSYYGRDPQKYRDGPFPRIDDPGQKFIGAQRLLQREPFWRDYDYVWLPDDDLATDQDEIDELFARMDAVGLELGHPALDWHSHYWHVVMVRSPSFSMRCADFVELMGPVFSRRFLERCLPTFDANLSGWGLSFVWPHMLGTGPPPLRHHRRRHGDAHAPVRRTDLRPAEQAGSQPARRGARAHAEARHARDPIPNILGAIDSNGRTLDLASRADQGRYGRTRQRDIEALATARPVIELAGSDDVRRRPGARCSRSRRCARAWRASTSR